MTKGGRCSGRYRAESRRLVVQSGRYLSSPRIPTTTVAAVCWDSQPFAGLLRGTKNYAVHHNGVHLLLELNYRGGRWLLSTMGRNAFTRRAVEVGLLGTTCRGHAHVPDATPHGM